MRYIFILINEIAYLLAQSAFIALVIIFSINILDLGITIYQKKLLEKEEILFFISKFCSLLFTASFKKDKIYSKMLIFL